MISKEIVGQIKEATNMVELAERYTELKQRGRDFWGCCPFHEEKTPSFKVDPKKQTWHCFGCGEGGDALDFIMKAEGLNADTDRCSD